MDLNNISPELREKAAGLTGNELLELAKSEGVELTDEQIEAVAGGALWDEDEYSVVYHCGKQIRVPEGSKNVVCPVCGTNIGIDSSH